MHLGRWVCRFICVELLKNPYFFFKKNDFFQVSLSNTRGTHVGSGYIIFKQFSNFYMFSWLFTVLLGLFYCGFTFFTYGPFFFYQTHWDFTFFTYGPFFVMVLFFLTYGPFFITHTNYSIICLHHSFIFLLLLLSIYLILSSGVFVVDQLNTIFCIPKTFDSHIPVLSVVLYVAYPHNFAVFMTIRP